MSKLVVNMETECKSGDVIEYSNWLTDIGQGQRCQEVESKFSEDDGDDDDVDEGDDDDDFDDDDVGGGKNGGCQGVSIKRKSDGKERTCHGRME